MYCGTCINGTWTPGIGEYIQSFNPSTNELLGEVDIANTTSMNAAIDASHSAYLEWRDVSAPNRGEVIRRIGIELRKHKAELGELISKESGKILQEGLGEVQEMIDIADFAVGQSRMLYGKTMHSERYHHRMYEQWHPLGVVGVISAFNFPAAVWAWNAFLAVVCGNTVVWKPSSKTPMTALAIHKICQDVIDDMNLNVQSIFNLVITNDTAASETLVTHEKVSLISFTGSTSTGRRVNELCAKSFKKTILELGGNNAVIIDTDSNLELAIPAIVFGAVGTAGQRCTSTRRVFVHKSMRDKIITKLKAAYKQITIGDPLDDKTLMGPLIDDNAVGRYFAAIEFAIAQGGRIVCGGEYLQLVGNFVEPTIIFASNDMEIVQQETFAPVLYIIEYETLDDVIAMHNDVPQGLSSSIFTNNIQTAERFLSAIGSDCGIANVNIGTSGAEIGGAFGGEKDTGGGRESGSDAWKGYMRRQTNTINWSDDLPLAQGIVFDL